MNLKVRFWLLSLAMVAAVVLAACGGGGGGNQPSGGTGSDGGAAGAGLNFTTPGEQLKYDPATASATAGGDTSVTFKNGASAQKHNWVLVKGGDDVAAQVAQAGVAAGEAASYVPEGDANVLAHTKVLNGGEAESITFNAPAGTYTYICTVPGHYQAGMKCTLTVQ